MSEYRFCPNRECDWHVRAPRGEWYISHGSHQTKAFGVVPRFRCRRCGRSFSTQTFSIDYYVKKAVDYEAIVALNDSSRSLRALGRTLNLSCGTVRNRIGRLEALQRRRGPARSRSR